MITEIYTSDLCHADAGDACMLENALLTWQSLQRITADPAEGCQVQFATHKTVKPRFWP